MVYWYMYQVKKTIHKLEREEHDKLQVHIDYLKFATKYAVEKFEEYESDLNGGDDEIDDIKNKKPSYVFYNDTKKRNRSSNNNNNKALTVDIDSSNFGLARDDNNDNYSNNDLNDENVTPSTSSVLNALDHLKSFVVGSPKLRNAIGTTTPLLPSQLVAPPVVRSLPASAPSPPLRSAAFSSPLLSAPWTAVSLPKSSSRPPMSHDKLKKLEKERLRRA